MNLAEVMDELGQALSLNLSGLRVHPFWVDRIVPPAAVVGWPDPLVYDETMGRGADRCTIPVTVLTGKVVARSARDELAAYADGSGSRSVKAVLEGYGYTACDSVRVAQCQFEVITVAAVDYLAGVFDVDIIGTGA